VTADRVPGFSAETVLQGLAPFQRDTVEHVHDRLYQQGARRFLVADETGLGKSLVARGVIARAVETIEQDDSVDRIDVVYVCSNSDIARQNLNRLDVTGQPHVSFTSRLTLLATAAARLRGDSGPARGAGGTRKPVNLVSFTPGTSFKQGWQTGTAQERALLFLLLEGALDLTGRRRRKAAMHLLRRTVRHVETIDSWVEWLHRQLGGVVDPVIADRFLHDARQSQLLAHFEALLDELGGRQSVPPALDRQASRVIGELLAHLARAGVEALEPDLVILDEFQRFRDLLDPQTPAGELAHHLFEFPQARVLLLSATPYKPFTFAEETGEDHHTDFLRTVRFLLDGEPDSSAKRLTAIADGLATYRRHVVTGEPVDDLVHELRHHLLAVMSRQERPDLGPLDLIREHSCDADAVTPDDLVGYVGLRALARALDVPLSTDYWKSAPYFLNFSDGYRFGTRLREALADPDEAGALAADLSRIPVIRADDVREFRRIDPGNARLRQLVADTVGEGWWRLLWVPPSLPYVAPGGPYAEPAAATMTKRLVFSSWAATPTAVASLLSHEASRRIVEASGTGLQNTADARASLARRFAYTLDGGRPQAMTTLALFWPSPWLARLGDPLAVARLAGTQPGQDEAVRAVANRLSASVPAGPVSAAATTAAWYWAAAVSTGDSLPENLRRDPARITAALAGAPAGLPRTVPASVDGDADPDGSAAEQGQSGLRAHVDLALGTFGDSVSDAVPPDLATSLAALALHGPGNCAWRALARLVLTADGSVAAPHTVTEAGLWEAAAVLANGLRSVFGRWESTLLVDHEVSAEVPYWRAVLTYCGWGNLQTVLDEYVHHLAPEQGVQLFDDEGLLAFAKRAADAVAVRVSQYEAFDPADPGHPIGFPSRFALRYGGRRIVQEDARQPEVRAAFNSPFWPFVLASTSVGQEGIDLHWWCHAVVHWNTPANPVDFEQREGRVNRYGGHAVRRNVAASQGRGVLASDDPDPWRAAYALAIDEHDRCGDFAPRWVYPGPAKIERHLLTFPLSADRPRYERLKDDVALYRLTFGQPRQEDMLELLRARGDGFPNVEGARIDLRPDPRRDQM
jgi:hypothetical protein